MERKHTETNYRNLLLIGEVVTGDMTGDVSIPDGINYLPPYVDELTVKIGDTDITLYLDDDWYRNFCDVLMEAAREA